MTNPAHVPREEAEGLSHRMHEQAHAIGLRTAMQMAACGVGADMVALSGLYLTLGALSAIAEKDQEVAKQVADGVAEYFLSAMEEMGLGDSWAPLSAKDETH